MAQLRQAFQVVYGLLAVTFLPARVLDVCWDYTKACTVPSGMTNVAVDQPWWEFTTQTSACWGKRGVVPLQAGEQITSFSQQNEIKQAKLQKVTPDKL